MEEFFIKDGVLTTQGIIIIVTLNIILALYIGYLIGKLIIMHLKK